MKRLSLFVIICLVCLPLKGIAQEYGSSSVKRVAVMDIIDEDGEFTKGMKRMVRGFLTDAITRTQGYEGYTREDISSIMKEHSFQRDGLVDPAQIKEMGKMTGADYIVILELVKLDEYNISYIAQILDVVTGRIANSGTLNAKNDVADYQSSCISVARKLLYNLK